MKLGSAQQASLAATVVLATLSVLPGGALPAWAWGFAVLPVLWPLWHHVAPPLAARPASVLAALAVGLPLAWWLLMGRQQAIPAASVALMAVLAVRQASRTLPSHDLQALILALLLVCVGAMLNPTPSYALALVPFALCMVAALVLRQLVHDLRLAAFRDPAAQVIDVQLARRDVVTGRFVAVVVGLSLSILALAGGVFAAFPRVGLPGFGAAASRGLPPAVALGQTPWAFGDGQVAARIFGLQRRVYDHGLYLRGRSYDRVDGGGFAESNLPAPIRPLAGDGPAFAYEVVQNAAENDPLLLLGPARQGTVTTSDNMERTLAATQGGEVPAFVATASGSHRARLVGQAARQRALPPPPGAAAPGEGDAATLAAHDGAFARHYLVLPDALRAQLAPLVREVMQAPQAPPPNALPPTFAQRAALWRRYFAANFAYDVAEPRPSDAKAEPLLAFLFDHRRGNCTYFASAYAAVLRASGVPARVVGGFEGGRWDADERVVIFTGAHAHAWVEWYQPGVGWVVDDATPARGQEVLRGLAMWRERLGRFWQLDVLQFGLANQLSFVHDLSGQLTMLRQLAFPSAPGGLPRANAPGPFALLVVVATALLAASLRLLRGRRRRRRARLRVALEKVLSRHLGRPLHPHETFRAALNAVPAGVFRQDPSVARALAQAVQVHESITFGDLAPPSDLSSLLRAIRSNKLT